MEKISYIKLKQRLEKAFEQLAKLESNFYVAQRFYNLLSSKPIGPPIPRFIGRKKVEVHDKTLQRLAEAELFLSSF